LGNEGRQKEMRMGEVIQRMREGERNRERERERERERGFFFFIKILNWVATVLPKVLGSIVASQG
jgi:hypothetical protein